MPVFGGGRVAAGAEQQADPDRDRQDRGHERRRKGGIRPTDDRGARRDLVLHLDTLVRWIAQIRGRAPRQVARYDRGRGRPPGRYRPERLRHGNSRRGCPQIRGNAGAEARRAIHAGERQGADLHHLPLRQRFHAESAGLLQALGLAGCADRGEIGALPATDGPVPTMDAIVNRLQLIKAFLAVSSVIFTVAGISVSFAVFEQQKAVREVFRYNMVWAVSQAVAEFYRFEQRVAAFATARADKDEVDLRFEILRNRLGILR